MDAWSATKESKCIDARVRFVVKRLRRARVMGIRSFVRLLVCLFASSSAGERALAASRGTVGEPVGDAQLIRGGDRFQSLDHLERGRWSTGGERAERRRLAENRGERGILPVLRLDGAIAHDHLERPLAWGVVRERARVVAVHQDVRERLLERVGDDEERVEVPRLVVFHVHARRRGVPEGASSRERAHENARRVGRARARDARGEAGEHDGARACGALERPGGFVMGVAAETCAR